MMIKLIVNSSLKSRERTAKNSLRECLSEGTLRLLSLCILEYDDKHTGLLCFEEPENGIHPFRMKAMANLLKDLSVDFKEIDSPQYIVRLS